MISKKKCNPQFFVEDGQTFWVCRNQIGSRIPRKIAITKCWKYNCPGIEIPDFAICKSDNCTNRPAENSSYCSQKCRHRHNQRNYRNRKKCQNTTNT
jgi:hypothetical protein